MLLIYSVLYIMGVNEWKLSGWKNLPRRLLSLHLQSSTCAFENARFKSWRVGICTNGALVTSPHTCVHLGSLTWLGLPPYLMPICLSFSIQGTCANTPKKLNHTPHELTKCFLTFIYFKSIIDEIF